MMRAARGRRARRQGDGGDPYEARPQIRLRSAYALFIRNFGPINLTTISETVTAEGETRETFRRPNLQPFLDDPDVWLVASIEDYDLESGTAKHGSIFRERVLHPETTVAQEREVWVTADAYLSGKIRTKLAAAVAAASLDERYRRNVSALERTLPEDLKPSDSQSITRSRSPVGRSTFMPSLAWRAPRPTGAHPVAMPANS